MKLFDFKFLILLGLALVIYFIYKELEYHRERLTYCEEKIKEFIDNKLTIIKNDNNKEISLDDNNSISYISVPSDKNIQTPIKDIQQCVKNKNLSLSLPIETFIKQSVKGLVHIDELYTTSQSSNTLSSSSSSEDTEDTKDKKDKKNTKDTKDTNGLKLKHESELKNESELKHLEIYSNDNDNNIETSISDSLMVLKNIQNLNNNSETSNSQQSKLSSIKSVKSKKETVVHDFLPKTLENNSSQELENTIDALKNELENTDSEQKTATSKNESNILSKMKLPELQALAKKENLSLDKKVNGHQKKKTKQDLIDELSKI
jgi:hypothetical protein